MIRGVKEEIPREEIVMRFYCLKRLNKQAVSVVNVPDDVPNVTGLSTLGHVVSFRNCFSNNNLGYCLSLFSPPD